MFKVLWMCSKISQKKNLPDLGEEWEIESDETAEVGTEEGGAGWEGSRQR